MDDRFKNIPRSFPSTHWSQLEEVAEGEGPSSKQALQNLLNRYIPALRTHLIFNLEVDPGEADDMLQGFITDKIVDGDLVSRADKARGRFRAFIKTALRNYVAGVFRRRNAKKRSPEDANVLSLDHEEGRVPEGQRPIPDRFDVEWGREVVAEALRRMRADCESAGREDIWGVFSYRVLKPVLENADPVPYKELVDDFDFRSPSQASNVLVTAKRKFKRLLRGVIKEYAGEEANVESEIDDLKDIFANTNAGGLGELRTDIRKEDKDA